MRVPTLLFVSALASACPAPAALRGAPAQPTAKTFVRTTDGVRLAVTKMGNTGPVVIIPNAVQMAAELAPLARDHQLVFYDPRNRGYSDSVDDAARVAVDMDVRDLEAVRNSVNADKIAIIGWTYYGGVATRYESAHPERVSRVILVAPMGSNPPYDTAAYSGTRGARIKG